MIDEERPATLLTRDDTFFGVCQGLGEDLGFHPNWLRLGLALLLFWNPLAAAGAYVAAGVLVAVSRLLFPEPRLAPAPKAAEPASAEAPAGAAAETGDLPLAA